MKNVAIYGGSFNPPHLGHVGAVHRVLASGEVDEVIVIPTFSHCFASKKLLPFELRYELCQLAFAGLPGVTISRVEQELGGQSRTLRTLRHLASQHPDWKLRLVVGSDVVAESDRWFGFDEIRALAPLFVLDRAENPVSSTQVREAIQAGKLMEACAKMPVGVSRVVMSQGLYGTA